MRIDEKRKAKKQSSPTNTKDNTSAGTKSTESKVNTIQYDSKFNKRVAKFLTRTNQSADLDKLNKAIEQLKKEGSISGIGGTHAIKQPIYSEVTQTKITGWNVIPISRKNDLRLAYKNHGDGKIEVKFGRAEDIGYKH